MGYMGILWAYIHGSIFSVWVYRSKYLSLLYGGECFTGILLLPREHKIHIFEPTCNFNKLNTLQ